MKLHLLNLAAALVLVVCVISCEVQPPTPNSARTAADRVHSPTPRPNSRVFIPNSPAAQPGDLVVTLRSFGESKPRPGNHRVPAVCCTDCFSVTLSYRTLVRNTAVPL